MSRGKTKDEQLDSGIAIAKESIEKIRHAVAGVQISAPFGKVEIAIRVIR